MASNDSALGVKTEEKDGGVTVRFPAGTALNESTAEPFQREMLALVAAKPNPHLSIDLSNINILTSVILGKLLALNKQARAAGGKLTILNPTQTIRMVFTVSKLNTVLDIEPKN